MSSRTLSVLGLAAVVLAFAWRGAPREPEEDGGESLAGLGRRINTFLVSIAKGEPDEGLDEQLEQLTDGSPLAKDRKKLDQLLEAIRRDTRKYGNFREVEQLRLDLHGQSMARATYLYKCQEYPLLWDFTFYRLTPDDQWTLIAMRFHVEYEKL